MAKSQRVHAFNRNNRNSSAQGSLLAPHTRLHNSSLKSKEWSLKVLNRLRVVCCVRCVVSVSLDKHIFSSLATFLCA